MLKHLNFVGDSITIEKFEQNLRLHFQTTGLLSKEEILSMTFEELLSKSVILVMSDSLHQRLLKQLTSQNNERNKTNIPNQSHYN